MLKTGDAIDSTALKSDAWHHRSDAITSAAAFIGIAIALWGGKGWESADDWAALVAALVIALNGARFLSTAAHELMDRTPDTELTESIDRIARAVPGVRATEKTRVRKTGLEYQVDLHVQADPNISLHEAHILSGKVKSAIKAAQPTVKEVLVHMEPWEE